MAVDFALRRRLGEGAFGEVWLAYDRALDVDCAVKLISPDKVPSQENFFAEAQLLKKLEHPNIVRVNEAGRMDDERLYIAMQYEANGSVADRAAGAPLPTREGIALLCDALRGLEHAHACSVVHRDIKPANILIGSVGEGKLSDFGLAAPLGASGFASPAGYLDHCAPEIVADMAATTATDVYAAGVTLYRMLNGDDYLARPLDVEDAICQGRYPDRTKYRLFIPRALKAVANRAMHVDPGHRYASVRALRDALEHVRIDCDWTEEPIADGTLWRTVLAGRALWLELRRVGGTYRIVVATETARGPRRISCYCHDDLTRERALACCREALTDFVTGRARRS